MMTMDDYDDCILGVVSRCGDSGPSVCYDKEKVIKKNMDLLECSREDAEEWFEFNQAGAYVGESTPYFLTKLSNFWDDDSAYGGEV